MKNIIFIAPPAAGKGTISEMIEKKYHIPHIATGDLLRNARNRGDEISKQIIEAQDSGTLVDDSITITLLEERITMDDCDNGYILDGFPRNVEQAHLYEDLLKKTNRDLGVVIVLDIKKEIAIRRIAGRRSCLKCNAIYNINNPEMTPKQEDICDICGGTLIQRPDDNEETYNIRYNLYMEKTKPLIDYYKSKGVIYHIDSSESKKAFEAAEAIIND
ncbi:MAG: nucleoside monophosphate kinase [Bacilli bacterium]